MKKDLNMRNTGERKMKGQWRSRKGGSDFGARWISICKTDNIEANSEGEMEPDPDALITWNKKETFECEYPGLSLFINLVHVSNVIFPLVFFKQLKFLKKKRIPYIIFIEGEQREKEGGKGI